VLGFRVDAASATVSWRPEANGRNGIRRLRCGPVTVSAIAEGSKANGSTVVVDLDGPLGLEVNGQRFELRPGHHQLQLTAPAG
jgi:hypothetical protein